jgi:hypothetical protein
MTEDRDLKHLYKEPAINLSMFCEEAKQLNDQVDLASAYLRLRDEAPQRNESQKYFVRHAQTYKQTSSRREEHLAIALWNETESRPLDLPDGDTLKFLDYQMPLKESNRDKKIGKVDLFAVIGNQSCVVELKTHTEATRQSDTPLRAFLEGLAYCAIVERNARKITCEVEKKFHHRLTNSRPILALMAPTMYWEFHEARGEGCWWFEINRMAESLYTSLGIDTRFIEVKTEPVLWVDGIPRLAEGCKLEYRRWRD